MIRRLALTFGKELLKAKGIASRDAEDLLAFSLGIERSELFLRGEVEVAGVAFRCYEELLKRRASFEPLQYILGKVRFFGLELHVNPSVLIPRPETELLAEAVVKRLKAYSLNGKKLWDVCCGSGCIGLALKKCFPALEVTLSDISQEALKVARRNSAENRLDVRFLQGDLFEPFGGEKADFVISNPPYVSKGDYIGLQREIKEHEPRSALVGGDTGFEFYERFKSELKHRLLPGGKAFFEIGAGMGKGILNFFSDSAWRVLEIEKDLSGRERFFFLERE